MVEAVYPDSVRSTGDKGLDGRKKREASVQIYAREVLFDPTHPINIIFRHGNYEALRKFSSERRRRKPSLKREYDISVVKYAVTTLSAIKHSISQQNRRGNLEAGEVKTCRVPAEELPDTEMAEEEIPDDFGLVSPCIADDPMAGHWNNGIWNTQERASLVDMGYDDDWKCFWNSEWWNNNKYSMGTQWHDLINYYAFSPAQALERSEERDEQKWNPREWNSLIAVMGVDQMIGDLMLEEVDLEEIGVSKRQGSKSSH